MRFEGVFLVGRNQWLRSSEGVLGVAGVRARQFPTPQPWSSVLCLGNHGLANTLSGADVRPIVIHFAERSPSSWARLFCGPGERELKGRPTLCTCLALCRFGKNWLLS